MIEIKDTDLPITVEEKIITCMKPDEIKEIADYLMVYYESHKEGE